MNVGADELPSQGKLFRSNFLGMLAKLFKSYLKTLAFTLRSRPKARFKDLEPVTEVIANSGILLEALLPFDSFIRLISQSVRSPSLSICHSIILKNSCLLRAASLT
jgi:hypothetical protein